MILGVITGLNQGDIIIMTIQINLEWSANLKETQMFGGDFGIDDKKVVDDILDIGRRQKNSSLIGEELI